MSNNLGSLVVSLGLDVGQFTRGLDKSEYLAKKSAEKIKAQMASIVTFVAGLGLGAAFAQAVRGAADFADEVGKAAQKAGVTTEAFSALQYAAQLADVSNEQLAKGLRKITIDAAEGGEMLQFFGIKIKDASGKAKSSDQIFGDVAELFSKMPDGIQKTALAVEIFGEKVGPELIPLLNGGRDGLKEMADEADRFGRIVKEDAAKSAENFNDNLTRLGAAWQGLVQRLAGPLIESLATTSSYLLTVARDAGIARAALITFGAAVARTLGLDDVGKLKSEAKGNANALEYTRVLIERFQPLADRGDARAAELVKGYREQFAQLQAKGQRLSQELAAEAQKIETEFAPPKPFKPVVPDFDFGKGGKGGKGEKEPKEKAAPDFMSDPYVQGRLASIAEFERESKRIFDNTRSAIEQLNIREGELQKLREKEYITDDMYWRAREAADDKYQASLDKTPEKIVAIDQATKDAEERAKRLGDAFSSTFDSAFRNGMKFGDLLKKLAFDAINIQLLTPAAQKAGSALSGIVSKGLGSLFGGFRANGGPVSAGKGYVVGERGPEWFSPASSGMITPNHMLAGAGSASASITQVFNFGNADAATVGQLRAEAQRIKAETLAAVPGVVMAAAGRGGSFAKSVGRA